VAAAAIETSQKPKVLDELLHAFAFTINVFPGVARGSALQRELGVATNDGNWGTKIMRCIGGESLESLCAVIEGPSHLIERSTKFTYF
jgi:hypothetical protein